MQREIHSTKWALIRRCGAAPRLPARPHRGRDSALTSLAHMFSASQRPRPGLRSDRRPTADT